VLVCVLNAAVCTPYWPLRVLGDAYFAELKWRGYQDWDGEDAQDRSNKVYRSCSDCVLH
jgi:hypothetical protein